MSVVDRDQPCRRCGALAARELADGSIECVTCGLVEPTGFSRRNAEVSAVSDAEDMLHRQARDLVVLLRFVFQVADDDAEDLNEAVDQAVA